MRLNLLLGLNNTMIMTARCLLLLSIAMIFSLFAQGQNATFSGPGANTFGAEIDTDNIQDITALAQEIQDGDTLNVTISGDIHEVCQAKGCWMTMEDKAGESAVFIKFKDYAFFVPLKAGGKNAVVSGKLYASFTPVDELRHYAEDKGASAEEIAAITEPEKELKMMADGVIVYNN